MAGRYITGLIKWGFWRKLAGQAGKWRDELYVLYLAVRDSRTPLPPKLIAVLMVGYLFSPIDFIADFIPLLGYVDDVALIPLGLTLSLRLIPAAVLADCRRQAALYPLSRKLKLLVAGAAIVLLLLIAFSYLFWRYLLG